MIIMKLTQMSAQVIGRFKADLRISIKIHMVPKKADRVPVATQVRIVKTIHRYERCFMK